MELVYFWLSIDATEKTADSVTLPDWRLLQDLSHLTLQKIYSFIYFSHVNLVWNVQW